MVLDPDLDPLLPLPGDLGTGLAAGDLDLVLGINSPPASEELKGVPHDLPRPLPLVFLILAVLLGGDGDGEAAEDLSSSVLVPTKVLGEAPEGPGRGDGWGAAAALALLVVATMANWTLKIIYCKITCSIAGLSL